MKGLNRIQEDALARKMVDGLTNDQAEAIKKALDDLFLSPASEEQYASVWEEEYPDYDQWRFAAGYTVMFLGDWWQAWQIFDAVDYTGSSPALTRYLKNYAKKTEKANAADAVLGDKVKFYGLYGDAYLHNTGLLDFQTALHDLRQTSSAVLQNYWVCGNDLCIMYLVNNKCEVVFSVSPKEEALALVSSGKCKLEAFVPEPVQRVVCDL